MPRGVDDNREKEYEELKEEFHKQHRYLGREEEVAARIVNKQRAQHSETKAEQEDDRAGRSPDRDLPIAHYDKLDVDQVAGKLEGLDAEQVQAIKAYELDHNNRSSLIEQLDRRLK